MRLIHKVKFDDPNKQHMIKAYLILVDEHKKNCDGCDEIKKCASVRTFGGTLIICEDCIRGILESLDPSFERSEKLNKILGI